MKFKGLPDVNWESVLGRTIVESQCRGKDHPLWKRIFSCFIYQEQEYQIVSDANSSILCFQSFYERKSFNEQLDNFAKLSNADIIKGCKPSRNRFCGFLFLVNRIIPWYVELRKFKQPVWLTLWLLKDLIYLNNVYNYFNNIDISRYKLLVTFCDSILDEAYVTELFKAHNIKTASLQHGQYTAFRENDFINSGVEIRTLKSDYLLAWNEMTVEECKRQGNVKSQIVICGILGYIGKGYVSCVNPNNKVFGVVINHPFFEKDNITLIKSANLLAKSIGYKYYLKLHPNYSEDHFSNIVDNDFYLSNIQKGIPIIEYANKCKFSLASSSSVFCELVYVRHRVLRYSTHKLDDKFKDVPYGLTFSCIDDVVTSYNKGFKDEDIDMLFSYLCGTEEVTREYKNFLTSFE